MRTPLALFCLFVFFYYSFVSFLFSFVFPPTLGLEPLFPILGTTVRLHHPALLRNTALHSLEAWILETPVIHFDAAYTVCTRTGVLTIHTCCTVQMSTMQ